MVRYLSNDRGILTRKIAGAVHASTRSLSLFARWQIKPYRGNSLTTASGYTVHVSLINFRPIRRRNQCTMKSLYVHTPKSSSPLILLGNNFGNKVLSSPSLFQTRVSRVTRKRRRNQRSFAAIEIENLLVAGRIPRERERERERDRPEETKYSSRRLPVDSTNSRVYPTYAADRCVCTGQVLRVPPRSAGQ